MKESNLKTLDAYVDRIDPIDEGERNETLYRIGRKLRKKFGLHGEHLLMQLQRINLTKCTPSLPNTEVDVIARSVDRSNTPLGPFNRSADRVVVANLLQKKVSIYLDCQTRIPSRTLTIGAVLEMFRTGGKSRNVIETIRNEPDKGKRNELKKQLPAVVFGSEPQAERNNAACKPNGILSLDLDNIPKDELESAKKTIEALSYVIAVFLSVSGNGLCALVAYEGTPDLKRLLAAMQADFPCEIDKSGSDMSRLRFATRDPDLIVKDSVIPFRFQEEEKVSGDAQNPNEPVEGEYCQLYDAFVLNPRRSLPSARAFRKDKYSHDDCFTLQYYAGEFYQWSGNHYQQIAINVIKSELLHWLNEAIVIQRNGPAPFPANGYAVNDVIKALQSLCQLDESIKSGAWLGKNEMPSISSPIFTQNCVYDWETGEKYPCSPCWFNLSSLKTVIKDDAPKPECWYRFLGDLWDDDRESKKLLHEFMGLCLTLDTSFQKMLLIVGPRRGGKGTIFRIMTAILGAENIAAPNASSLATQFGIHSLLGKPLATISDARFSGKHIQVAIERLLNISGEDSIMVDRKHRDALSVKLPTRFMIASNEMPMLPDSSGAIASRFLFLRTTKSFLGNEDRGLISDLLQELPGILKLMISGLRRLHRQGFTQTSYQADIIRELEELGSPIRSFVQACCVLKPGEAVSTTTLWKTWREWCEENGQRYETQVLFGRNLKTCFPEIAKKRRGKKYCYLGIGLIPSGLKAAKSEATDDEDTAQ